MDDQATPSWRDSDENLGRNCVTVVAVALTFVVSAVLAVLGHEEVLLGIGVLGFGVLTLGRWYFGRRVGEEGTSSVRGIVSDLSREQAYEVLEKALGCLDLARVVRADAVAMVIAVTVPPSWASTTGERVTGSIGSSADERGTVVRFESERLEHDGAFDPRKNRQNLDEAVRLFREFEQSGGDALTDH